MIGGPSAEFIELSSSSDATSSSDMSLDSDSYDGLIKYEARNGSGSPSSNELQDEDEACDSEAEVDSLIQVEEVTGLLNGNQNTYGTSVR
ncbi:hypothetical protein FRC10_002042 [Ceratobasidium sp. 414]|nr:hypothetical protein FRC10_002042 [Ceratobasidium sp. 414]